MPYNEAQKRATMKYQKNNYDHIHLQVPKGKRDELREIASAHGESVNGYIKKALRNEVKRDTGQDIEL